MRTARGRSTVLLAAAAWTVYVWVTRIWNILRDPAHGAGFKAVHGVLAAISIAFAVAVGVIGLRMRREARAERPGPAEREPAGR
ncbi:MAG TPA: hypothetical protein VEP73_04550 [Actinomycetota bacterium]|nr:hypothetical protein [Actinomycetota bacterium]